MSLPRGQVADPAAARGREGEERALELRREGYSYREIAKAMGGTPSLAHKRVSKAMERQLVRVADLAEQVKALELDRLDAMFRGVWKQASDGGLLAIDRALRIMERRAKLLGLDAPLRTVVPLGAIRGEDEDGVIRGAVVVPAEADSVESWVQQHAPKPTAH